MKDSLERGAKDCLQDGVKNCRREGLSIWRRDNYPDGSAESIHEGEGDDSLVGGA